MAWAACPVILRLLSTGIPESGDGVMHHLIAKHAWQHPHLLLDHWGKPLFTTLSSGFAQLGLWGMTLFNALCFVATCWAADVMLKDRSPFGRWLFAPLLMCMPAYGAMVFAGLTEVLFGGLAMLAVCALWTKRYTLAMAVASFLPFARPEYVAVWPFLVAWVCWRRQWKALPWILMGHVCYAIAGTFVFGDPLWAFTRDPYTGAAAVYGQGPLLHFTDRIQHIYGAPFMWALAVALVLGAIAALKPGEGRRSVVFFAVTALLPAFAIIAVHSVLWWKGLKGSLGLTRVLATGAPLGALFVCAQLVVPRSAWSLRSWQRSLIGVVGGVAFVIWAVRAFLVEHPVPVYDSPVERVARVVGEVVGDLADDHARVVHAPPLVTLFAGIDPFDTATTSPGTHLRPNDLLVWDAAFGPNEGGMPLSDLLSDPTLTLLQVIEPEERWPVLGGNPMEYFLFAKHPSARVVTCEPVVKAGTWSLSPDLFRYDRAPCGSGSMDSSNTLCLSDTEFPMEFRSLQWDQQDLLYAQVNISGGTNARLRFVMEEHTDGERTSYWAQDVGLGDFLVEFRIPVHGPERSNKLYLINLDRVPITLADFGLEVCCTRAAATP